MMGRLWSKQFRQYRTSICVSSTPLGLVPDTHAHTHDGQRHRQAPRNRPDIGARLTGSCRYRAGRAELKKMEYMRRP